MESKIQQIVVTEFRDSAVQVQSNELQQENKFMLVKIEATPINPLDLQKISGTALGLQCPFIPGSEAAGEIVQCLNKDLIGRKCTVLINGAWASQAWVDEDSSIIWEKNEGVSIEEYSCGYVNPMTALGLIDRAITYKAKGIVNVAANSAVGKLVQKIAAQYNMNVINLVRTQKIVLDIKQQYQTEYVLDYQDENFEQNFKQMAQKLEATVVFDPVGGDITGKIFNNLPPESYVIIYGSLSGKNISGIDMVQVRWANKKLEGFVFMKWWATKSKDEQIKLKQFLVGNYKKLLLPTIREIYKFDDVQEALQKYKSNMAAGKIILKPTL